MNDDEVQYLRELLALLDGARRFEKHTQEDNGQFHVHSGSSLAGDNAKSAPYHLSHAVWHALTVAVDHLQCLRSSLIADTSAERASTVIHTHSQASLLRGVLENSSRAVWLLAPASRRERVKRSLGMLAREYEHSHRVREMVQAPVTKTKEERFQTLESILAGAGVPSEEARKTVRSGRIGYKQIVREAGQEMSGSADVADVLWSACSALAHGDSIGTLSFLDRKELESDGTVTLTEITGSIPLLYRTAQFSVGMLGFGFALYERRATSYV